MEAAQAVEEDDRIWAEKRAERYLAVQERAQALARAQTDAQLCARALTMQTCESESALGLHMQIASSEKDRDGKERQIGSLPRLTGFPLLPSLEIDIDGDGEEGDDSPDSNFSLELYISSLGYLLSALPSRDASHMDEMHRIEMRARLEEGLCRIGVDPSAELERAVALRVEREREREEAPFPKEIHHHHHYHGQTGNGGACGPLASLAHLCGSSAARRQRAVTTSRIRPRTQSVPALISSAALDLGLTLGAGALSTATKSLGCLASHISSIEQGKNETDSQGTELSDVPADVPPPAPSQQAAFASRAGAALGLGLSGKQWEMAVAVAGKAASVLASSLWAIALPSHSRSKVDNDDEDDDIDDAGKNLLPAHVCDLAALSSSSVPAGSSETYTPTAEDRLILLAATLARSLKRSPLPSQARAMLLQLVQVMQAFDRRFELRRKAVDVALEKTAKTLKWARRHQLHTRVVKFAWVAGEAALAAIEAYRDEKGWDPLTKTTGKEAALAMTAAAAADVNVSMPMPMSTREKDAQSQSLARRDP